jgi:hypothetical protein
MPLTDGDAVASSFIIAPTTGGSTGPRTSTRWLVPVPANDTCTTLVLDSVAVVVDLELVQEVGSKLAPGVSPGVRKARVFITRTIAPVRSREDVDVGEVLLRVELDFRSVLVIGRDRQAGDTAGGKEREPREPSPVTQWVWRHVTSCS